MFIRGVENSAQGGGSIIVTDPANSVISSDYPSADYDFVIPAAPGLVLTGFSFRETAGIPGPAKARIIRGDSTTGVEITNTEITSDTSGGRSFPPGGIDCSTGISIKVSDGVMWLAIYYRVNN